MRIAKPTFASVNLIDPNSDPAQTHPHSWAEGSAFLSSESTGSKRLSPPDDQSPGLGHRAAQIPILGGDVAAFGKILDAHWAVTLLCARHLVDRPTEGDRPESRRSQQDWVAPIGPLLKSWTNDLARDPPVPCSSRSTSKKSLKPYADPSPPAAPCSRDGRSSAHRFEQSFTLARR